MWTSRGLAVIPPTHAWTLLVAPFFVTVAEDRSIITIQLQENHRDVPYMLNEQNVSQQ